MKGDFLARQRAALTRRVQPQGPLTLKQVAHGIGVHADTLARWAHGEAAMDGGMVGALDSFFIGLGDVGFLVELYGEDRAVAMKRRADKLRAEAERVERAAELYSGRAVA